MKNLKITMLTLVLATVMAAFSTVVLAEASEGRIVYTAADALDLYRKQITLSAPLFFAKAKMGAIRF